MREATERWRDCAPGTRLGYNTYLRHCLTLCGAPYRAWEGIPHVKSPAPRQVTVTDAAFESTLSQADSGTAFCLLACRDAALRSGTVFALTLGNFSPGKVATKTKNGGWVEVPVSHRLAAMVESARVVGAGAPTTPVYQLLAPELRCEGNKHSAMARRLKRAQKKAGTSGWTWHDLRRTAAHQLYKATGDLRDVRDLLGHHNLGSSLIYLAAQQQAVTTTKLKLYASGKEPQ